MGWKHIFASIFLIALIPISLADSRDICPTEDLISPCFCKPYWKDQRAMVRCESISGNDVIMDVLNNTSDYGYEYLSIDESSINYIPSAAFEIKKIVLLIIMDTTMISLFNKAPNATSLQGLELYGLKLTRTIQWDLFTGILNLRNLNIEDSSLHNFDEQFVKYAPKSLERITIRNCSISKLHDEAFAGMNNLIDFVMDKGKIKVVKRSMWPSPGDRIEKFSMKNQLIEYLPEDIFKGMSELRHIWLTDNHFSQISENTFKPSFAKLLTLKLDGNPIKCNCTIRWLAMILETDRRSSLRRIIGKCEEPKSLHGADLANLRPYLFEHCAGT